MSSARAHSATAAPAASNGRRDVPTNRRISGLFMNRRAAGSTFSVWSAVSALPAYSAINPLEVLPPDFESTIISTGAEDTETPRQKLERSLSEYATLQYYAPSYCIVNPRYSTLLGRTESGNHPSVGSSVRSGDDESTLRSMMSYPLKLNKNWATLHLFSTEPKAAVEGRRQKAPRCWGGEPIAGVLNLDIEGSQTISEIDVILRGKVITGPHDGDRFTFFEQTTPLWHKSMGDPRQQDQDGAGGSSKKFDGKLSGRCQFPISIPFPTHVDLCTRTPLFPADLGSTIDPDARPDSPDAVPIASSPTPGSKPLAKKQKRAIRPLSINLSIGNSSSGTSTSKDDGGSSRRPRFRESDLPTGITSTTLQGEESTLICPIPQSFMETKIPASIQYEITLNMVHGWLRPDSKIKAVINHIPALVPPPTSFKRQFAYETSDHLCPPWADAPGWFELPKIEIKGTIKGRSGDREVSARCTLNLAKPLSYTRGSTIPCYWSVASEDSNLARLLTTPHVPQVRLIRKLHHFHPWGASETTLDKPEDAPVIAPFVSTLNPTAFANNAPNAWGNSGKGASLKTVVSEVASAVWWTPKKDVPQQTYTRHLEGEIHLPPDAAASSLCSIFMIEYVVEILPPRSSRFEVALPPSTSPTDKGKSKNQPVLACHPVEIATRCNPTEPIPLTYSEPPKKASKRGGPTPVPILEEEDGYSD